MYLLSRSYARQYVIFQTPDASVTSVYNLFPGVYEFCLTVRDIAMQANTDCMFVNVSIGGWLCMLMSCQKDRIAVYNSAQFTLLKLSTFHKTVFSKWRGLLFILFILCLNNLLNYY